MTLSTLHGGAMPPQSKTEPRLEDEKRHTRIVRMDSALWERLRLAAFDLRRSQNDIIVEALEDWLDQHDSEAKP